MSIMPYISSGITQGCTSMCLKEDTLLYSKHLISQTKKLLALFFILRQPSKYWLDAHKTRHNLHIKCIIFLRLIVIFISCNLFISCVQLNIYHKNIIPIFSYNISFLTSPLPITPGNHYLYFFVILFTLREF